jgi:hypothetical protein
MTDKKPDQTTREQALRVARMLGCQGAHETENGWMPCGSHEEYEAIKKGKEEYLKVLASKKKKPLPKMVQRTKRLETKSDAYYENRADAVAISKARGCGGVRTVMLDGKKYYSVCNHRAPKKGWENLDEKPITGIATLPGGGLVTGSFSGKALVTSVGRPIGGVSEIDGDGDGLTSNARGEDIIPVIARNVLEQIKKVGPEGVEMQLAQRIKGLSATLDDQDFSEVVGIDTDRRKKIVSQYDRMPVLDEKAKKAYDQFAGELDRQFKFLEEQGIKFEFVDEDPYKSFYEMHEDFIRNRRLKVMKTSVTGSHPYWSDATNDKFRAVHDVLGHLATGRGFDRHGEEAAYQAHKLTLPAEVHGALAMETRGQNAFLIERGDFPPQKAGVLPDDMIKKMFDALYTKQEKIVTSDDDNLFEISGSHHVSGGRHFPKNKMKQKGFVNFVSRSTDPDTFSNAESARIRARNLGCIGIRRYTASDGKLVWLPCTNVSDYNRVTGIRGDNSPRNNPRRQGSKFGKKVLGTPIGSRSNEDGDGDGFTTGGIIGGEDKIPVVKLPDVLTTDALKKMRSDVNPDFLDPKKSSERHGDEEFSAAELMKLPAENAYNLSLLDSESAEYLEDQRRINSGGMNQRIRQEGVFYPIILREWADGKRSIYDGHHRLIAAYDNHPDFRVPVFVWKEEVNLGDEFKSVERKGFGKKDAQSLIAQTGLISFKGVPKPKKKPPTVTSTDINNLAVRVRQHNAKAKASQRANLRDLKNVYMRGLEDGDKTSANKRISKFLSLLMSDKPKDVKYFDDNDLLPLDHPWRNRKTTKKWAGFDDGEYGVKYAEKCCPRVVKRHYAK